MQTGRDGPAATITGARQDLLEALKTFEGKREAAKICQKAAKVESEQSKILNAKAAMINSSDHPFQSVARYRQEIERNRLLTHLRGATENQNFQFKQKIEINNRIGAALERQFLAQERVTGVLAEQARVKMQNEAKSKNMDAMMAAKVGHTHCYQAWSQFAACSCFVAMCIEATTHPPSLLRGILQHASLSLCSTADCLALSPTSFLQFAEVYDTLVAVVGWAKGDHAVRLEADGASSSLGARDDMEVTYKRSERSESPQAVHVGQSGAHPKATAGEGVSAGWFLQLSEEHVGLLLLAVAARSFVPRL